MPAPALVALEHLGRLVGVLTDEGGGPHIDGQWFADPAAALMSIPTRLDDLVAAIAAVLAPLAAPPMVAGTATWYVIHEIDATAFCAVVTTGNDNDGSIAFGIAHNRTVGDVSVNAFVQVPLFAFTKTGATFDALTEPCTVGVEVATTTNFTVDGTSFTSAAVVGSIILDATHAPTLSVSFLDGETVVGQPTYSSVRDPAAPEVASWLAEVVVQAGGWLSLNVGAATETVGDLLVDAGFLAGSSSAGYTLSLQDLAQKTPSEIALGFAVAVLDTLAALDAPLVALPGGGASVVRRTNGSSDDYGLRLVLADPQTSDATSDGVGDPPFTFAVGTWLDGETDQTNWLSTAVPDAVSGASVFVLRVDDGTPTFVPAIELASIGLDVRGAGDAPLLNLDGTKLAAIQLRAYLAGDAAGWRYGFAARLDEVAFPLGSSFTAAGSGNQNPVARSLVASSDSTNGATTTVNPGLSVTAAYVAGSPFELQLLNLDGHPTDTVTYPIQQRFGPLDCQSIGVRIDLAGAPPTLAVLFDGGVSFAGLAVELDELSVGVPLHDPTDTAGYSLDLQGLSIAFSGGGVEISGGLLKITDKSGGVGYDGEALIKAESLALSALGSYVSTPTYTSLFVFAVLDAPLGGPPFLYVTGLAAGFGYDRALRMPTQDEVPTFPLVEGLADASVLEPASGLAGVLAELEQWVPVTQGEYWLAAGLTFSTFELLRTNAVVAVEFGRDFVLGIVGTATLRQPPADLTGAATEAWVEAELDVDVVLDVGQGELDVSAVLSPQSYILTKAAHLTGGFAARAWFGDNPLAGQFVVTLGGYHPAFVVPAAYPNEPRVGIDWKISDKLELTGDAYAALTPLAMMAGAGIDLTFADGSLKAWLRASADLIIEWRPFYFDATVSVSVGISFRIDVLFVHKTLSIEVGADVELWGPPVGGIAHVHCYVVSFTITLTDAPKQVPPTRTWDQFKGLLPTKPAPAAMTDDTGGGTPVEQYLNITAQDGLLTTTTADGRTLWLVRPSSLQLTVGSVLAATTQTVNTVDMTTMPITARNVDWQGGSGYSSVQTILIGPAPRCDPSKVVGTSLSSWSVTSSVTNLPSAMWVTPGTPTPNPPAVVAATTGVVAVPSPVQVTGSPVMDIATVFADEQIVNGALPLSTTAIATTPVPQPAPDALADIATVQSAGVIASRTAVFQELQSLGWNAWTNGSLADLAAAPGMAFTDEPMEGSPVAIAARGVGA